MRSNPAILITESSGISECLDRLAAQKRTVRPLSTYRLQFNAGFRFADAQRLVGYLHALGVSHIYSSPVLKARAGSLHGYDIIDHNSLNPEVGNYEDFQNLVRELKNYGMGQILDFVPNHMGVGLGINPWWWDVLASGRAISPLCDTLHRLIHEIPEIRQLAEKAIEQCIGTPEDPRSFDCLHRLLEAQVYRLANWRVSGEEINYRRFFDINDLVGLRMENPHVFAATHQLLRKLLAEDAIQGIRIDHCDGLLNPVQYLVRIQMLYAASQCSGAMPKPPLAENGIEMEVQQVFGQHDWMSEHAPLYTVVEKILEPGEDLPTAWPIDGTSGYDFTTLVNGVFIERRHERAITNLYHRFTGASQDVDTLIYNSKKLIMHASLASEVNVLAHMLDEISSTDWYARDFTRKALRDVIRETIACFPVYRTYIDERGQMTDRDRVHINDAVVRAKRRNPDKAPASFDFLRDILLLKHRDGRDESDLHKKKLYFTLKFQQLTGPVMAKGLEDTTCYVYNRFISVNEVGGTPRQFGISMDEFHEGNLKRATHWPFSMLATSTHDTKRSEDVRARLNVLSEMPKPWASQTFKWRKTNRTRKRMIADGRSVPDLNEEYFLYQTLVGSWPFDFHLEQVRKSYIERI